MNIFDAVELATMDLPERYRVKKRRSFFQRVVTSLSFRKPGPKPIFKEVTYRGRNPAQLASRLSKIGEFREDPIGWDTLNQMRHHPMVKLGTVTRAAPVLIALRNTRIECEDPRISAFVKEVFVDNLMMDLAISSIVPSYQYGTAPHEKVWENKKVKATYLDDEGKEVVAWDGPALVYKKIKFVHPESLEGWRLSDDTNSFEGFEQKKRAGDKKDRVVDKVKAFVYVNRFLYGGFWGESEYRDIYPHWYYSEFFEALRADYLRFKAIPPMIGWAPVGVNVDQDGNDVDNLTHAGEILQAAYDNLVVILPYDPDERGNNQWGFKELQIGEHSEVFTRAIEDMETKILRGLIVPERTVTQNMAAVGSYNQASIHAERMLDAGKVEVDHFLSDCTKFVVPQLVMDNFGPDAPPCRLWSRGISEELKEKLTNVVITVLQNDRDAIFSRQVAFAELLDILNIPFNTNPEGFPDPEAPDDNEPKEDKTEDDSEQETT